MFIFNVSRQRSPRSMQTFRMVVHYNNQVSDHLKVCVAKNSYSFAKIFNIFIDLALLHSTNNV